MNNKVLVAMSGGVDSSVAAYLLKKKGYDVTGVTMYLGVAEISDGTEQCCGTAGIADARDVCEKLDIPHLVVDYYSEFETKVIKPFLNSYKIGRTPNPCVLCNQELKFNLLWNTAREHGCDFIATGHYARIIQEGNFFELRKAVDPQKDQSYFLYMIPRTMLHSILFPLGELHKSEVRVIAKELELPVAEKKESQDICFIPSGDYRALIRTRKLETQPGPIVDINGRQLGTHEGIAFYTIGQRKGLGANAPVPYYVLDIDAEKNRIIVGEKEYLKSKSLQATNLNLLIDEFPAEISAKIRYQHKPAKITIDILDNNANIFFKEPQESITPGQSIVFYQNDLVLGGGIISEVEHGYRS
ncbi:MAG TPA: tRNA 2-thiouridine(34) synthase MnmA [Candidatus Cloacimonadota bacterium]|nr:tRNA 2-thiouridine(34) synthase MnmA [Candidatus Cloacimonadota bacterium]HPT71818.1 tRNA 2-thiouridine(34) synthase MnmA [Candidatus Cloacimonadota bacterium]